MLGVPELDAYSRWSHTRVEQGGRITSLDFLPVLLWIQLGYGWPMGYKCSLPAHVQCFTHQQPQVLLSRASLDLPIPLVTTPGVALTQIQHLVLGFVEQHEILQAALWIPSFRSVNSTTWLGVICKFSEGALNPSLCNW